LYLVGKSPTTERIDAGSAPETTIAGRSCSDKGDGMKAARWVGDLSAAAILAGVYFVAGKLGLMLASVHPSASAVWPPTGIALAAVLLFGNRVWPGILIGAFLVNVTTAGTVATSLGIATGNTLEALVGAHLVSRFAGGRRAFDGPQGVFLFVVLAGLASTAISPTFGVTSLALGGFAPWSRYGAIWLTWWLGDAGGALAVAPPLILWSVDPRPRWSRSRALEATLLLVLLVLLGLLVFGDPRLPAIGSYPLSFLCMPVLLWPAFRFGQRETATAALVLSGIAVWGTLHGLGPLTGETRNASLLLLQAFTVVSVVTAMSLAAVVAERRRAHRALQRQADELARSNAELQQFAYVASHDLQEPLRMVTSFVQLLGQRYRGRLDKDADEFIGYAVEGALRMRDLINDLLAFSRSDTTAEPAQTTDCALVLRQVLADLSVSIEESGAVITSDTMPIVMADITQLTQVFQNLIGNAIKFRGERRPEIHVGATRQQDAWLFSVRDNGIGIHRDHAERIFSMFQRLHPRDRYSGSGIGLAICKKIVARHGGRIWVESEPQRGATFCFTLPFGS
jgi:signal transduction histidine kinase